MDQAYEVVAASIRHIRPMSECMRSAAAVTLQGFGFRPREALRRAFVMSRYARTALKGGRPIAMWGVKSSSLLDDTGIVWLVLSDDVAGMPVSVVKEARRELAKIMDGMTEIAATVLPTDIAAIRFAVYLGFHDRENDDGRLSRKELCEAIMADPQYRVPVGDHYVIALGYHPEIKH